MIGIGRRVLAIVCLSLSAAAAGGAPAGRTLLTAPTTFYVDPAGSDGNDGSAPGPDHAFATLQRCVNFIRQSIDTSIFEPTCRLAPGRYDKGAPKGGGGALIDGPLVGSGVLNIDGDLAAPRSVVLDGGGANYCIQAQDQARVRISHLHCRNAGVLFAAWIGSARMQLCAVDLGDTIKGGSQVYVSRHADLEVICSLTNSGTQAGYGIQVSHQGNFRASALLTGDTLIRYDADIAFSDVNILVSSGGDFTATLYLEKSPYDLNGHTVKGQRWRVDSGGVYQSIGIAGGCSQEPPGTVDGFVLGAGSFNQACHQTPVVGPCGDAPAMAGSDYAGFVVEGEGTTGCVIRFQTPFSSVPYCTVGYRSEPPRKLRYSVSPAALVIEHERATVAQFTYTCNGF